MLERKGHIMNHKKLYRLYGQGVVGVRLGVELTGDIEWPSLP